MNRNSPLAVALISAALLTGSGCKSDRTEKAADDHGHSHNDGHDHSKDKKAGSPATQAGGATQPAGGDHPNQVTIGEATANGLKFTAKQDEPLKPGGEGAFDLQVTGYPAGGKPKAVRFWVGAESGEGSVPAKATEETPDNWHTHVELPSPIPAGAKFWAEVEPVTGEKFKVSFDPKM